MKSGLAQIQSFLSNKTIAIVGASRNPKKFGYQVTEHLVKHGYHVVPIHREASEILGLPCVRSIGDLPASVSAICIVVPKHQTDDLLRSALDKGIREVWIQQMSDGPETAAIAAISDANIVRGRCIFMYSEPEGVHKFHERMNKLFLTYAR